MMTDSQLEAAARELCRLRGEEPDLVWRIYIYKIRAHEQMQSAIAVGMRAGQQAGKKP